MRLKAFESFAGKLGHPLDDMGQVGAVPGRHKILIAPQPVAENEAVLSVRMKTDIPMFNDYFSFQDLSRELLNGIDKKHFTSSVLSALLIFCLYSGRSSCSYLLNETRLIIIRLRLSVVALNCS